MEPLLSICIPTYDRLEILCNTIDSIFAGVSKDMFCYFEVVVSDNSLDHNCRSLREKYAKYSNFHYYVTNCEGFLNSYYALTYGKGHFLKLLNNTALLKQGALNHLIKLLKENVKEKPLIFFTDGYRLKGKLNYYSNFNDFMEGASYFTSWSTGFGIWKVDFDKIKLVSLNKYYPQTSLLATQTYKQSFVVDDINIFVTQDVPHKGGYNIFRAFSVDYVNIIKQLEKDGFISMHCYNYVKKALLYKFLSVRYFKTVIAKMDKFDYSNVKESILVNYSYGEYLLFKLNSLLGPFRFFIREMYKRLFTQLK